MPSSDDANPGGHVLDARPLLEVGHLLLWGGSPPQPPDLQLGSVQHGLRGALAELGDLAATPMRLLMYTTHRVVVRS